jgi:hypothetical protein
MVKLERVAVVVSFLSCARVAWAEETPVPPVESAAPVASAAPVESAAPVAAAAPVLIADERQVFMGWHPSGEVHYLMRVDAAQKPVGVNVCRAVTSETPAAWPAQVKVDAVATCTPVHDEDVGGDPVAFAQSEVAGNKGQKTSPYGLSVELGTSSDGSQTTYRLLVVDGGDKTRAMSLLPLSSAQVFTLGEVLWRKDGAAVAVALEEKAPPKGTLAKRVVVVADATVLLQGGGPAGRKVAVAKEKEAAALMKKRDWAGAGRVLDEALVADPRFARARYARAAAEAQGGVGRTTMIENLQWLKEASSTDPEAKKLLDSAKRDPVFDAWCGEPEVRDLLGLPAVSTMEVPARLLERAATWSVQGSSCRSPWVTLVFQKAAAGKDGATTGQGTLEVAQSCKGEKKKQKQPFSWAASPAGPFVLSTKPLDVLGLVLPATSTMVLDDTYQQFKLVPTDGSEALGTFEPGRALLDDAVL